MTYVATSQPWANRDCRPTRTGPQHPTLVRGLTLAELLMTVAVMALLCPLALAAVGRARTQTRTAVCEAQLAMLGQLMLMYSNDNGEFIPGVNTTGIAARAKSRTPGAMNSRQIPVQSFDWMTPLLQNDPNLPDNRAARFHYLYSQYRCPSQNATAWLYGLNQCTDQVDFDNFAIWPACSYLMSTHFSLWGQNHAGEVLGYFENTPIPIVARVTPPNWEAGHAEFESRLGQVGPPARKIFAGDGTRYIGATGMIDVDVSPDPVFFGAFSSAAGWYASGTEYGVKAGTLTWGGRPVTPGSPSHGQNLPVSYRHGLPVLHDGPTVTAGAVPGNALPMHGPELDEGNLVPLQDGSAQQNSGHINAVFFDGHVERLNDYQSRAIELWYATGSVVQDATAGMTDVPAGYVIP